MYDQVVQSQRAGLCLSEHFLILFVFLSVVVYVSMEVRVQLDGCRC